MTIESEIQKVDTHTNLSATEVASVRDFILQEMSINTRLAYQSDWKVFTGWCRSHDVLACPALPETIAVFLASEANRGLRPSTVARRLAAIRHRHKARNITPLPTEHGGVLATLRGIRRACGTKPEQKAPATSEIVKAMIVHCPSSPKGIRDKALLLIGFASASRRSELAGLRWKDLEFVEEGLRVTIRRSKTNQEGVGLVKAIVPGATPGTCPIRALKEWLKIGKITTGPVFRQVRKGGNVSTLPISPYSIAQIVKRYAAEVGLEPDNFAGHSLRSGFCTSAAQAGSDVFKIMDVTGHRSVQTLRCYIRKADEFRDHAGAGLL